MVVELVVCNRKTIKTYWILEWLGNKITTIILLPGEDHQDNWNLLMLTWIKLKLIKIWCLQLVISKQFKEIKRQIVRYFKINNSIQEWRVRAHFMTAMVMIIAKAHRGKKTQESKKETSRELSKKFWNASTQKAHL